MLSALVSAEHRATFDAGVLVVRASRERWAKLCLERSPHGTAMVVSVVTRGTSDDCNSATLDRAQVHLRVTSRLERAYAFHSSMDGASWQMVRYFSLGDEADPEVGFLGASDRGWLPR